MVGIPGEEQGFRANCGDDAENLKKAAPGLQQRYQDAARFVSKHIHQISVVWSESSGRKTVTTGQETIKTQGIDFRPKVITGQ